VKVVGSDRSIEPAFPLLLTHDAELCVELNKLLPQHYQTIEQSCNFLVVGVPPNSQTRWCFSSAGASHGSRRLL